LPPVPGPPFPLAPLPSILLLVASTPVLLQYSLPAVARIQPPTPSSCRSPAWPAPHSAARRAQKFLEMTGSGAGGPPRGFNNSAPPAVQLPRTHAAAAVRSAPLLASCVRSSRTQSAP
jgi:hypothetical protein